MSLIDDINRDFPFQVTLALDDELTGVLDWLDARLGHGTCMSTCATRRSAIASAILAMHPRSAGASATSGRRVRETEVLGSHSENRNLMSNDMFPTWPATERIMDTKRNDAAARTAVTRLLKQYFENLRTRLAAGTAQFWGQDRTKACAEIGGCGHRGLARRDAAAKPATAGSTAASQD